MLESCLDFDPGKAVGASGVCGGEGHATVVRGNVTRDMVKREWPRYRALSLHPTPRSRSPLKCAPSLVGQMKSVFNNIKGFNVFLSYLEACN